MPKKCHVIPDHAITLHTEAKTYQVIYEVQNWMIQNIKVCSFVKRIEAHLQQMKQEKELNVR